MRKPKKGKKEVKLKRYGVPYKKTVWGMLILKAKSKQEALDNCTGLDIEEEYENKSNYELPETADKVEEMT